MRTIRKEDVTLLGYEGNKKMGFVMEYKVDESYFTNEITDKNAELFFDVESAFELTESEIAEMCYYLHEDACEVDYEELIFQNNKTEVLQCA